MKVTKHRLLGLYVVKAIVRHNHYVDFTTGVHQIKFYFLFFFNIIIILLSMGRVNDFDQLPFPYEYTFACLVESPRLFLSIH